MNKWQWASNRRFNTDGTSKHGRQPVTSTFHPHSWAFHFPTSGFCTSCLEQHVQRILNRNKCNQQKVLSRYTDMKECKECSVNVPHAPNDHSASCSGLLTPAERDGTTHWNIRARLSMTGRNLFPTKNRTPVHQPLTVPTELLSSLKSKRPFLNTKQKWQNQAST